MASLDNIYDIIENMDQSGIEYLLITIQKGKKAGKADIFYKLENSSSLKVLAKSLALFSEEINKKMGGDQL